MQLMNCLTNQCISLFPSLEDILSLLVVFFSFGGILSRLAFPDHTRDNPPRSVLLCLLQNMRHTFFLFFLFLAFQLSKCSLLSFLLAVIFVFLNCDFMLRGLSSMCAHLALLLSFHHFLHVFVMRSLIILFPSSFPNPVFSFLPWVGPFWLFCPLPHFPECLSTL